LTSVAENFTSIVIQISWKKTLSKHLYCKIWHYLIVSAPSNHTHQSTQGISPCSQNSQEENKNIALLGVQNTHLGKPLQKQVSSKLNKPVSKLTNIASCPLKKYQSNYMREDNSKLSQWIYA